MIKFSINKSFFLQALNATKRAISTKNAIPVLSTIKIEVQNSNITLTGSNGQISIENTIPTSNENAGLLITSTGLMNTCYPIHWSHRPSGFSIAECK